MSRPYIFQRCEHYGVKSIHSDLLTIDVQLYSFSEPTYFELNYDRRYSFFVDMPISSSYHVRINVYIYVDNEENRDQALFDVIHEHIKSEIREVRDKYKMLRMNGTYNDTESTLPLIATFLEKIKDKFLIVLM